MNNYKCKNGELIKQGMYQKMKCKYLDKDCWFVRYCIQKKELEFNADAPNCKYNPDNAKSDGNKK